MLYIYIYIYIYIHIYIYISFSRITLSSTQDTVCWSQYLSSVMLKVILQKNLENTSKSCMPNSKGRGRGSFPVFRKNSPPISLYYDPSLIKNFYKATNPPPLIKLTAFRVNDLTGRYNSVFFKLTPLPVIPVEHK